MRIRIHLMFTLNFLVPTVVQHLAFCGYTPGASPNWKEKKKMRGEKRKYPIPSESCWEPQPQGVKFDHRAYPEKQKPPMSGGRDALSRRDVWEFGGFVHPTALSHEAEWPEFSESGKPLVLRLPSLPWWGQDPWTEKLLNFIYKIMVIRTSFS